MNKLNEDLSVISSIPVMNLKKINAQTIGIISHYLLETLQNKDEICDVDIGIGILKMKVDGKSISYKFIPSPKLETSLIKTVITKEDSLEPMIEEALVRRITNHYKDLFQ